MPDQLIELLYQLPVAGLMLVVVWRFLVFIKERDAAWLETVENIQNRFLSELERHQDEAKGQREETIQVMRQNTTALSQATQIMGKVDEKLQHDSFERAHAKRARG